MSTTRPKLDAVAPNVVREDPRGRSVPGIVPPEKDSPSGVSIATPSTQAVSEGRFRAIAEQSSDLMMIANRERVVQWANAAVERVLGYPPQSLVGTNIFPLFHPDDVSALAETTRRLGEVPGVTGTIDVRMRAADGSWHWMETSARNLLEDPTVRGLVVSFRDVTDQRVAEAALRASEARYADLFEHARDAVFIADLDARLLSVNLAVEQLTGYSRAELLEMNVFDLIAPEDQVRARARAWGESSRVGPTRLSRCNCSQRTAVTSSSRPTQGWLRRTTVQASWRGLPTTRPSGTSWRRGCIIGSSTTR